jgi:hypothetical protein
MPWGLYGRLGRFLTATDPNMQRILAAVQWQVEHFEDIPVLVVACLRGLRPVWPPVALTSYYGSIYPSVQNLLLAARAAGLGAALITLPLWSTWLARQALSLPWRVHPLCRGAPGLVAGAAVYWTLKPKSQGEWPFTSQTCRAAQSA